ncbi:MAG TPA: serine protease, partial [Thermoanaerobaculia bacterium]|nr:serine protease [Thermoanaerobaculia bacterium]
MPARTPPRTGRVAGARSPSRPAANTPPPSPPELVVIAQPQAALRASGPALASAAGADVTSLAAALAATGVALRPLFGLTEERLQLRAAALAAAAPVAAAAIPDLSRFYTVDAPSERLDAIAERLRETDVIEAAFVKPGSEPAQLNDMVPSAQDAPPITADFTGQQGYLDPAPGGIDARFAWTRTGGNGTGMRIIDIEGAWRFTHEDLGANQG